SVAVGDAWLQANLDGYVQWAQTHNSLLIFTFDEDDSAHANRIATIFVGPMVSAGQYSETINHYNILRTIEDMYGLPYIANAATASPITAIWTGVNVSVAATDPTATENSADTGTFTFTRTGDNTDELTANFTLS